MLEFLIIAIFAVLNRRCQMNSSMGQNRTASELFCTVVIAAATMVSLFSNNLLLVVLHKSSSAPLGRYRVLLAIFAICNLSISLMHAVFQPIVYFTSTGVYVISRKAGQRVFYGESLDVALWHMYVMTFYETFLILAYHYVYRYKTVTSLLRSSCTDQWSVWQWSTIGMVTYALYVGAFFSISALSCTPSDANAPIAILDIYGIDLRDPLVGFAGVVSLRPCADSPQELCWHRPTAITLMTVLVLSGATVTVIGYCIHQTRAGFRSATNAMSPKTKRMQRNLFNALLIQTAVPCVLSYAPVLTIAVVPVVSGIALGEAGNLIFSITPIFPAIDSFFVLFFITRLRDCVIRYFRQSFAGSGIDALSSDRKDQHTTTVQLHKTSVQSQKS